MKQTGRNKRSLHNRIKSLLRQKQGMTMVEMVVTIVLISLFAVGTCQILATTIRTYHDIRSLQESQEVSDSLLDKVCGEIEGAQASFSELNKEDRTEGTLLIKSAGAEIELRDRTGSTILMGKSPVQASDDKNYLNIHYYKNMSTTESGQQTGFEAVDWKFDPKMYMGFWIEDLKFELAGDEYAKNVIHVTLTLKNKKNQSFTTERYVKCYNFKAEAGDFDNIISIPD